MTIIAMFFYFLQLNKSQLPSGSNSSTTANGSSSTLERGKLTEDKLALEKARLKKLEEELSKKLRQPGERHTVVKSSAASLKHEEERASSDSELLVKKSSTRGLTPPVEFTAVSTGHKASSEKGGGSVDVTDSARSIFKNSEELEKVKKMQVRDASNLMHRQECVTGIVRNVVVHLSALT